MIGIDASTLCRGFFMVSCNVPSSPRRVSQETVQRTRMDDAARQKIRDAEYLPPEVQLAAPGEP